MENHAADGAGSPSSQEQGGERLGRVYRQRIGSSQPSRSWALSDERWWRRAVLASTVALSVRSRGRMGDVARTLVACRILVNDHDDMVVRAMSWALRELIVHDAGPVSQFLTSHDEALTARVKREVTNKLTSGLKNPRHRAEAT